MFKILKICILGIWNVWFYVLCFIGIVISMPFLIIFSLKESWYPFFFWVAKNIWSNTVMYGMGFYPSIKWKEKFVKYILNFVIENCIDDLNFLEERLYNEEKNKPKNERNELKQANSLADISDPPYSFCSNFEKEYLIRLFNKVDGRD